MICGRCEKDLAACICPDLRERFEKILQSEYVVLGINYQQRIREQIERNEREQSKTE